MKIKYVYLYHFAANHKLFEYPFGFSIWQLCFPLYLKGFIFFIDIIFYPIFPFLLCNAKHKHFS